MGAVTHKVSFRNGTQVMVAGLKLHTLGYKRGASIVVSDPDPGSRNASWRYVVANDEHATMVSRAPAPPDWIQPGVTVLIDVTAPSAAVSDPDPSTRTALPAVQAPVEQRDQRAEQRPAAAPSMATLLVADSQLREWRSEIVKMLNSLEPDRPPRREEGLAGRISRLSREGRIPRAIGDFMHAIAEYRNRAEYDEKALDEVESDGVAAAWRVVAQWDARRRKG